MTGIRVLVIDNYDSFVYNLVQYLGEFGVEPMVFRNDEIDVETAWSLTPDAILISPGPGRPGSSGISMDILRALGPRVPTLGVCLGHQCIGELYGAKVSRAPQVMHGKVSMVHHGGAGVLSGLPTPFRATRYHSLIVQRSTIPACLEVTAETADGIVMALRHRDYPIEGVQFHPESILTDSGHRIIYNFLAMTAKPVPEIAAAGLT